MADVQQATTPPILPGATFSTPGAAPTPYTAMIQQQMAQQANTSGLTQMGPSVPNVQVPVPQAPPQQRTNNAPQPVGAGQGGAVTQANRQNTIAQVTNMVNSISTKLEQRKAREQQKTFDSFAQASMGATQAQSQYQQAQQDAQKAIAALKADPQDQSAKDALQSAQQRAQQAKQAMNQNATILNDIASDPKKVKMLQKGYGIDDKNANTPERQQAISAIKKNMPGVGRGAAGIISGLPQTQQLSPQAQQQAMARQAGVIGAPATGSAELTAAARAATLAQNFQIKSVDQAIKLEAQNNKAGLDTQKIVDALPALGMMPVRQDDGSYARNPDGTLQTRNLTAADVAGNPMLSAKLQQEKNKSQLADAQAKATAVRAQVSMMAEQRKRTEMAQAMDPGSVANFGRLVTDPSSGVTLATIPAASRRAVVDWAAANGKVISKPLTSDELKRSDLATNALSNIAVAKDIVKNRPDLFGPAGWGKSKYEMALQGGDPDAVKFQAAITLANLPAVGIHGVRGQWAIEDLDKLDGNLYLQPAAMNNVLDQIDRSASEFQEMGGHRTQTTSPQGGGDTITVSPDDMK